MTTRIDKPFIVQCKLTFGSSPETNTDDVLRRSTAALGQVFGEHFAPSGKRAASFLRGEISAGRISLIHPGFTEEKGYANSWLSMSVDIEEKTNGGLIFVGIHMGKPGEQADLEWQIGLEVVPRIVQEINPSFGFMNGGLVDVENTVFPPDEPEPDSVLPAVFTPWTFFDAQQLNEGLRKKLADLPAVTSEPMANGWVVQAVKHLRDQPNPEFLSALKTLTDKPIRYMGPVLEK